MTAFYTTTEHKPVTWGANSGGALLSFYDVTTPIARQVLATGAGDIEGANADITKPIFAGGKTAMDAILTLLTDDVLRDLYKIRL